METKISTLKDELLTFQKLQNAAFSCYKFGAYNLPDMELLQKYQITSKNYTKLDIAISQNEAEIADSEKALSTLQTDIISTCETLSAFEKIMSMTYVDSLVNAENERRQAKRI